MPGPGEGSEERADLTCGFEGDLNIVEVYVRHLRAKLDRPFGRDSIQTVRGAGYALREQ